MQLVNGSQLAHQLYNPSLRPPTGAGTVRRVGLAIADADDGIELEHPAQEGLGPADASAHRQILEGVDQYEAVIPLNRPFNPPSHLAMVGHLACPPGGAERPRRAASPPPRSAPTPRMPFYLARSYGKVLALLNNSVHLSHGLVELVGAAGEDREGVGRGVEGAGRGEEFAGFEVFYGGECLADTVFGEGAAALVGEVQAAADEYGSEEAAEHVLPVEAPAGFEGKFLDARATEDIVVFPEGLALDLAAGLSRDAVTHEGGDVV